MRRMRVSLLIVVGLMLAFGLSQVGQSQDGSSPTSYVVVTLEELTVEGGSSSASPKLMLGAVTASGPRVQTQTWPNAIWAENLNGRGTFLSEEAEAVPLFALPEADMGERLAFGVVALDNRVPENDSPEDWLNVQMPALVEAASGPVARWGRSDADSISGSQERQRIGEAIQPHIGPNRQLGILTGRFPKSTDWGVREAPYETSVATDGIQVTMRYRVQRVAVPPEKAISARLQRLRWSGRNSASLVLWSRTATGFSGETLNAPARRLPLSGTFDLAPNSVRSLDTVLVNDGVGPFLYLNVGAWDRSNGQLQSQRQLTRFWTIDELMDRRSSALSLETDSLALDLAFELPRRTQQNKVYWAVLNRIQRANLDGSNVEDVVDNLPGDVRGVAVDPANEKLYWALPSQIQRADLEGSSTETAVGGLGISDPQGVAVDARNGWIYWTDAAGNGTTGDERIQRARLDGTNVQTVLTFDRNNPGNPGDIALDVSAGKMYWANTNPVNSQVQRADLDGSQLEALVANLGAPSGLALDLTRGHVYWTDVNADRIQRADLNGRRVRDVVALGRSLPNYLDLDPQGGHLYWTDQDEIRRANLDGSSVESIVTGLEGQGVIPQAQGIAVFLAPSDGGN